MKKVSIVVPLYKSADFMPVLIDSILNQTYKNIELILVDDESPDTSGKIAEEYAEKDPRIKVIHKKNGGCCDARNRGLELVTGDYLMFADGDDWMELDCVEYLVGLAENNNCEMAMSDSVFTTNDRKQNDVDNIRVLNKEEATCAILYVDIPVGPWNKIYTTKVIKENNLTFSVPWFGEGLYFSVMSAQMSNKVAVGHKRVYNYRLNNPNAGTTLKEVKNALSALSNIHYIKENLLVKTAKTIAASNMHTLVNCYMVVYYIYTSNAKKQYQKECAAAVNEYRNLYFDVMKHSKMTKGQRLRYSLLYISPTFFASYSILKKRIKSYFK